MMREESLPQKLSTTSEEIAAEARSTMVSPTWAQLREGDFDENVNKTVHTLIFREDNCIVYLDEKLYVEWHYNIPDLKGSGAVFNRISLLESIPMQHLSADNQVAFRRMVGEALARCLSQRDLSAANQILDNAEKFINARNSEIARRWQLSAAVVVCTIAFFAGAILWITRVLAISVLGSVAFGAVMGSCAGAVGAMTSLLLRIRQMSLRDCGSRSTFL
jgi:hypothetical protein